MQKIPFEKFVIGSVVAVGVYWFALLSVSNKVFGLDAWFYMNFIFHKTIIANAFALGIWLAVLFSFTFRKGWDKTHALLIGSLFMLNAFNLRLLMPDPDNYIFLLAGIIIILYFKNNPIGWLNHKTVGFVSVLVYFFYRNFTMVAVNGFTDMIPNPVIFLFFIPTYYLFYVQKKYKCLAFILILLAVFMTGKFATNALPLFIYALYLDLDRKIESGITIKYVLIFSLIMFLITPIVTIQEYDLAVETICEADTKVCQPSQFAYYFYWLGYNVTVASGQQPLMQQPYMQLTGK